MKCKYCGCLASERKTEAFTHQEVRKIRKRITAFMIKVVLLVLNLKNLERMRSLLFLPICIMHDRWGLNIQSSLISSVLNFNLFPIERKSRAKKKSCTTSPDSVTKLFVKVRLVTDFWNETILLYHSIS